MKIKFIDLFAGMGGTRVGFEQACLSEGIDSECVFTSEIKSHAVDLYQHNFGKDVVYGDITKIDAKNIPDFDVLLAGFPCQSFSTAGKQQGFNDTRGTLFFDVVRILKEKQPSGFLLENVEGLVTHDRKDRSQPIGNTLEIILNTLNEIGYTVVWKVIDSSKHGVPQRRKRIYIIGTKSKTPSLENLTTSSILLGDVLESGLPCPTTPFRSRLLELYSPSELMGKSIKDKRGGTNNIHSWDLQLKGALNTTQTKIMSTLLKQRRRKVWAELKGIEWMDGIPLTAKDIHSFFEDISYSNLVGLLDDLVAKRYLAFEHPKKKTIDLKGVSRRVYDTSLERGYNIVAGKLSFELTSILSPHGITNTLVATEVDRIGVIDKDGIRNLSIRECLRISGFPDSYQVNIPVKKLYDLIGNTVVPPVIAQVAQRLIETLTIL